MSRVFILRDDDVILYGDFCRPLDLVYLGQSDTLLTSNTYSGRPINHTRWIQVERAGFGDHILGKLTVAEYNGARDGLAKPHQHSTRYEFCRGLLPEAHILPPTRQERREMALTQTLPTGKYAGKTLKWVQDHDDTYFRWMGREGLAQRWCGYPGDYE